MDDGYQNEDYYNDDVSEKISHTEEVHSEFEPTKAELGGYCGNIVAYSSLFAALYTFEDDKRGPFVRKPVSIFSLLLLCSLIMVKAAFVMTSVRCKSISGEGNWGEVRSFCRWLGADLMIIDNKMEQDFLIYKMDSTKNLWIGLHYAEGVPGWQWVDGTELTFE
ncbi:secretory phospholipase A2 receptor-like [Podarcis muralis]